MPAAWSFESSSRLGAAEPFHDPAAVSGPISETEVRAAPRPRHQRVHRPETPGQELRRLLADLAGLPRPYRRRARSDSFDFSISRTDVLGGLLAPALERREVRGFQAIQGSDVFQETRLESWSMRSSPRPSTSSRGARRKWRIDSWICAGQDGFHTPHRGPRLPRARPARHRPGKSAAA